ncbi:MAG TPA: hypothetical protein VI756_28745 [Blastocatellia bacterium]
MQFAQIRDYIEVGPREAQPMDVSGLLGTWVNSNPDTTGVARMTVGESGGKFSVRVYAIGPEGIVDWGSADISVYASSPTTHVATGFTCVYDFGFVETRLQAMILKGLIVLAQIHRFKDDSGRTDYFVREYFKVDHNRY